MPPFDPKRSVDGERGIEIIRPIPVSSEGLDLKINSSVIGVYDKGVLYETTTTAILDSANDV